MALDAKQHRFWERFFPGLISAVNNLGAGEFVSEPPILYRRGAGLKGVVLHLRYDFSDGDRNHVQIKISLGLRNGCPPYVPPGADNLSRVDLSQWERIHYSFHYGSRLDKDFFRFDLDDVSGHHVHMIPMMSEHIPVGQVEPDVRDLDPLIFVKMIAAFREQRTYPVRMKR